MIRLHVDPVLGAGAVAHLLVGAFALVLLVTAADPLLGVHPALKPMKFGFSIAFFLGSMAILVPALAVGPGLQRGLAWTLVATMVVEMVPIAVQALRGTTSHFNVGTRLDAGLWQLMVVAIVIATLATLVIIGVATLRPLGAGSDRPLGALATLAWRAGLWMLPIAALSGFAMGGRLRHSVGGDDGGAGLPLVNWSTRHGDLRVSHFIALHALQTLPLLAGLLAWLPIVSAARWVLLLLAIGGHAAIAVATLLGALAGRPVW